MFNAGGGEPEALFERPPFAPRCDEGLIDLESVSKICDAAFSAHNTDQNGADCSPGTGAKNCLRRARRMPVVTQWITWP